MTALLMAQCLSAQISLSARGRTYTINTVAKQLVFSSGFGRRWLYQPAVIKPASETGYQWVMLFVTCNQESPNCVVTNQGLYMATSSDGLNFGTPVQLLGNPPGVTDFIAPRVVYVNGYWHVYCQGVPGTATNNVYSASGSTLMSLAWNATPVIQGSGAAGIGEDFQVYSFANHNPYSGDPILVQYNDWGYSSPVGTGGSLLGAVGDGNTENFWYGPGGCLG